MGPGLIVISVEGFVVSNTWAGAPVAFRFVNSWICLFAAAGAVERSSVTCPGSGPFVRYRWFPKSGAGALLNTSTLKGALIYARPSGSPVHLPATLIL